MRILVVSNLYPHPFVGGYELGCRDIVERLYDHEVTVLTSTYGRRRRRREDYVLRWLTADLDWRDANAPAYLAKLLYKEHRNRLAFHRAVVISKPELVYFWNMRYVSAALLAYAQRSGLPLCAFISDDWLATLDRTDSWLHWCYGVPRETWKALPKRLLSAAFKRARATSELKHLCLRHAQFASNYLKVEALEAARCLPDACVIHWGVDLSRYPFAPVQPQESRKLLFVGQIAPHKGVHTAIEAVKVLIERYSHPNVELTIAGGTSNSTYHRNIAELANSLGISNRVHFQEQLPRELVGQLYRTHEVLLFPSLWQEPFSIVLLEGMASGTAVVTTSTGGTREIVEPDKNALVFAAGNACDCAAQVNRLLRDPALANRLREHARAKVEASHQLESMVAKIDHALRQTLG